MLHDRQQLDMREPHRQAVRGERLGDLAVVEHPAVGTPPPRSEMDLVGGEWSLVQRGPRSPAHPRTVAPAIVALVDDAGGAGWVVRSPRQGIRLEDAHPVAAGDQELVAHARTDPGAEQLPHARAPEHPHWPGARIPEVRVADHADAEGIRRPHAERRPDGTLMV